MFGSQVLEIAIGLIFIYLLLSLFASAINEMIASLFSLRGKNLISALKIMLENSDWVDKFYDDPHIKKLSIRPIMNKVGLKTPPSFISKETFSKTFLRLLKTGEQVESAIPSLKKGIEENFNHDSLKILKDFVEEAGENIEEFQQKLEDWYDEMMRQATEWYRSKVRFILFVVGVIIAISVNANTIQIVKKLSINPETRQALVNAAEQLHAQGKENVLPPENDNRDFKEKIDDLSAKANQVLELTSTYSVLGIGWGEENVGKIKNIWDVLFLAAGWLITAFAISLGAPFWYDMLGRVVSIRSAAKTKSGS